MTTLRATSFPVGTVNNETPNKRGAELRVVHGQHRLTFSTIFNFSFVPPDATPSVFIQNF